MGHAVGRPKRKAVDDDLASMFDFLAEHAPDDLAAWVQDVRLTMATFEAWRSREVVWVKSFKNAKQEDCYRDKNGKVIPAESLRRNYERMEDKPE